MTASSSRTRAPDTTPIGYAAAVDLLRSRGRFGISLGLQRVTALLDELDHPERGLRGALVGGTNGKGSVVALALAVLGAAGLRVGSMPKPHLVAYRERIAIDGRSVSAYLFAAAVASVLPAIDAVTARLGAPTEFEALTAAAFAELARSDLDLVLVEVGRGGAAGGSWRGWPARRSPSWRAATSTSFWWRSGWAVGWTQPTCSTRGWR